MRGRLTSARGDCARKRSHPFGAVSLEPAEARERGSGDLDEDKHPKHLREASCSLVARPLLNLSVGRDAHRFNRRLPGRDGMHAARQAVVGMRDVTITYARGQCDMAASRDYWDEARQRFVCGFNPDGDAPTTVTVAP